MDTYTPEWYARHYDATLADWPGELDFYRSLAARHPTVLEVACGTGRVATRLAAQAGRIVAFDLSPEMLAQARRKAAGGANLRLLQADMRAFDLEETFDLAIIPGHSFQFMLTPADQAACLRAIHRHLEPGGRLVVHLNHQNVGWLGELVGGKNDVFNPLPDWLDPQTGNRIAAERAWCYRSATQTASTTSHWVVTAPNGEVIERWTRGPIHLHCVFRFEMEHLLLRCGFSVEGVFGDFAYGELKDASDEMVWLARK